jgi:hypothetical protein
MIIWLLYQLLLYFHIITTEVYGEIKQIGYSQLFLWTIIAINQRQICYFFIGLSEFYRLLGDNESYRTFVIFAHVSRIYSLLLIGNNLYLHLHIFIYLISGINKLDVLMHLILLTVWLDFIFELYSPQMIGWMIILLYHHQSDTKYQDKIYLLYLVLFISY